MNRLRWIFVLVVISSFTTAAQAQNFLWWDSSNALAQHDEYGQLHHSKQLDEPDYAPRESWRLFYYNKSRHELVRQPAYVGALQVALQRRGYYCGPIDGVFSVEVQEAIEHMQKNYGMRVTGQLTVSVRRALYLP